jgi:hypothetical protein
MSFFKKSTKPEEASEVKDPAKSMLENLQNETCFLTSENFFLDERRQSSTAVSSTKKPLPN